MTTKLEQAARQVVEVCNGQSGYGFSYAMMKAVKALREALAEQAEYSSVAFPRAMIPGYYKVNGEIVWLEKDAPIPYQDPLSFSPAQQVDQNFNFEDEKWLTDESDCELCGGSGQVQIVPFNDHKPDCFGCPACIERELTTEINKLNLNCKSVQKRLATSWGYTKSE